MDEVRVRYLVDDVDEAIAFYSHHLGFSVDFHPGPGFAVLARGGLRLLLNATHGSGGAARPLPDGRRPGPGGWNRIQLLVEDLERAVGRLEGTGATFRNTVVEGNGGRQVLLDDPSGNPIELFEPWSSRP